MKTSKKSSTSSSKSTNVATVTPIDAKKKPVAETTAAAKPAAAEKPEPRREKLPIARRVERQVAIAAKRWGNLARITKGWSPQMDVTMGEVNDSINTVLAAIKQVGNDFKAPKRSGGGGAPKAQLEVGQAVHVREACLRHYKDIIEEKALKALKVKRVAGKKVLCTGSDGETIIIPRGHLAPTKAA
jgi:hypothetical protein